MTVRASLRSLVDRSVWATCVKVLARNVHDLHRLGRGDIEMDGGALPASVDVAAYVE